MKTPEIMPGHCAFQQGANLKRSNISYYFFPFKSIFKLKKSIIYNLKKLLSKSIVNARRAAILLWYYFKYIFRFLLFYCSIE